MDVDRVEHLAAQAGKADVEMAEAIRDERGARVVLLRRVIDVVLPHLPSIASKVTREETGRADGDRLVVGERSYFEWRGVLASGLQNPDIVRELARIKAKPEVVRNGRGVVERLEGRGLFISERGDFVGVVINGSIGTDGGYAWTGTSVHLALEEVVSARWPAGEIVANLAEEIEAQLGGKQKVTRRAASTAKAMRAAAEILEGVR